MDMRLLRVARRTASTSRGFEPRYAVDGPLSFLAAATRSSFKAERQRANTASAMALAGIPRSSA